jgi:hypothetical protein
MPPPLPNPNPVASFNGYFAVTIGIFQKPHQTLNCRICRAMAVLPFRRKSNKIQSRTSRQYIYRRVVNQTGNWICKMNWIHLSEWLNVSITVRWEREKCHLGYFRKHNLFATLSFAFQFVEAAVWKCNRTSIEYEFILDTHARTHTHTMTTKAAFFYHLFPQF